jgi:hypothetical protein
MKTSGLEARGSNDHALSLYPGSRRVSASVTAATISASAMPSSQETGAAVSSALLPKPMHGTTSVVRLATAAGSARMMRNQQA